MLALGCSPNHKSIKSTGLINSHLKSIYLSGHHLALFHYSSSRTDIDVLTFGRVELLQDTCYVHLKLTTIICQRQRIANCSEEINDQHMLDWCVLIDAYIMQATQLHAKRPQMVLFKVLRISTNGFQLTNQLLTYKTWELKATSTNISFVYELKL